ncbi:MAG: carbamoyltransferase [Desulfovibrionaceae bacterium]|nr:carbamoyltransferase [Desulfovibrionaceae bacterium]MBF0514706.1 carbamoyltransferase [Desulfovibrionaceae bacterium]
MNILGITCYGHDSSVALVQDGELISAVEEERFNRVKHSHAFPTHSIEHCLKEGGIGIEEVDHIGFYLRPWLGYWPMIAHFFKYLPKSLHLIYDRRIAKNKDDYIPYGPLMDPLAMLRVGEQIREAYKKNKPRFKFHFIEHHICHQASSFLVSPFDESACLSVDGCGEWCTTMTAHGHGNRIDILERIFAPHTLGTFYNSVCEYLGFTFLEGPGKVMGLASYGDPDRYYNELKKSIFLLDEGRFKVNFKYFNYHVSRTRNRYSPCFEQIFGPPRMPGAEITKHHEDVAAGLQRVLEEACFHILTHLRKKTNSKNLCLSGGVALNSVMNGKVLAKGIFDDIFVQAAASDSGCSIGAAFHVYNVILGKPRVFRFKTACVGAQFSDQEIENCLKSASVTYEKLDAPARKAAELLAQQKIVGWFQGRAEFGPRALGCRSILTAPFPAEMKDILNERVKHRESYRPFAPVILEEYVGDFFEINYPSPFMLFVFNVKNEKRNVIPAVTHVDGTGRIQTVNKSTNGLFYDLIKEFNNLTNIPVILNTSFNVAGMPIVNSPSDALDCFLNTEIDYLIIGNYIVSK